MNVKSKKTIKVIVDIILWVFLVAVAALVITIFVSRIENPDLPKLGDNYYMTVQSESMSGVFEKGDVVIVQDVTKSDRKNFKAGQAISFYMNVEGEKIINTHYISSSYVDPDDNLTYYNTYGHNNPLPDANPVCETDVIGLWTEKKISNLGSFINFLQSPTGFIVFILLPMAGVLIYQLVIFINTLNNYKNRNKITITKEDEELIKQKAIEEYIAKMKAEQASKENKEE